MKAENEKLVTVEQLAEYLNLSKRFVYEHTSPRCVDPIPNKKLGKFVRFRLSDVEEWLANHTRS